MIDRQNAKQLTAWATLLALLSLGFYGCGSGDGAKEKFPSHPLAVICPWAAGGGTDTVSRIAADGLSRILDQKVNVVSKTGGAGVIGHSAGANAKPDGYTLTMITAEINMMHWRGLTKIGPEDFKPLMQMNKVSGAIIVKNDSPWQTVADLRDAISANPKQYMSSGTAKGGIWHLASAGWTIAAGQDANDLVWIPSEGAAPALRELISGGVHVVFCAIPEALSLLESGEVRALAVLAADRNPKFPNVPTSNEDGVSFEIYGWCGLAAPKDTPQEVCSILETALAEVVQSEEFKKAMDNAGFMVDTDDAQGFQNVLVRDDQKFGELLKAAGIVK